MCVSLCNRHSLSFKFLLIVPWIIVFFPLSVGLGGSISQLDSVWQYCLAIIRCFRMNGIDPLLTTFVSYCVWGVQQRRTDVWKWLFDSLFHPHDLSFCVPSPWECHASLLYFKMFQKVPFVFAPPFFLKRTQNCSWSPPVIKDTSDWGTVHKCNAIWLIPTFVRVSTNDQT